MNLPKIEVYWVCSECETHNRADETVCACGQMSPTYTPDDVPLCCGRPAVWVGHDVELEDWENPQTYILEVWYCEKCRTEFTRG